jgi:hypothetical protein
VAGLGRLLHETIARLLAFLLLAEALVRGVRLTELLPALPGYDPTSITLVLAGGVVAALEFTSGWMLLAGRLPASTLACWSWAASAAINTLSIGFSLAPTLVYPWLRWQATVAYWVYAIAAIVWQRYGSNVH